MGTYVLRLGTQAGLRVVVVATGETATVSGRVLDNMSQAAAEEAIVMLERRDALREQRIAGAIERNDIVAILDNSHPDDDSKD